MPQCLAVKGDPLGIQAPPRQANHLAPRRVGSEHGEGNSPQSTIYGRWPTALRGHSNGGSAADFASKLGRLPITTDSAAPAERREVVMALAREHRLTAHDATYLDLALRNGAALATFDGALASAMRNAGGVVRIAAQLFLAVLFFGVTPDPFTHGSSPRSRTTLARWRTSASLPHGQAAFSAHRMHRAPTAAGWPSCRSARIRARAGGRMTELTL